MNTLHRIMLSAAIAAGVSLTGCTNKKNTATDADNTEKPTIVAIQDNVQTRLMPRSLFPAASDSLIAALGLEEGIPSSVCVFLAQRGDKQILFDTGNGIHDSRLISTLDSLGIAPTDIDYIFVTHLHPDHIGGLLRGEEAAFANATLYVPATEHEAWMAMPREATALWRKTAEKYEGRLRLFANDETLPCGIIPVAMPGHTPGHTTYLIGNSLIAGDIMHGVALQLAHPHICANFDMQAQEAIASRKALIELARRDSLTVYGMHFPAPYYLKF